VPGAIEPGREILCEGGKFVLVRWTWTGARASTLPEGIKGWLVPIAGGGAVNGERFTAGQCWMVDGTTAFTFDGDAAADVLFAYPLKTAVTLDH